MSTQDDQLSWGYGNVIVTTGVCKAMCCATPVDMYFIIVMLLHLRMTNI